MGGSSIEASKIAGHCTVRPTEEYTKIQRQGQEELTRVIQERLATAAGKNKMNAEDPKTPVPVNGQDQLPLATKMIL